MRGLHKAVTVVLILLCIAGGVFTVLFLKNEEKLAAKRQQEIGEVEKELEPVNEERRQWEKKNKEWQTTLADKQKGRPCVLLSFDNMSRELYDTIFDLMDQYGFRGTFAMRNGRMPSWEMKKGDEDSSGEMMQELLDAGWDYAVSVGAEPEEEEEETEYQRDFSDEFGEEILESETEGVSEEPDPDSGEGQTESETEAAGFLVDLDAALNRMSENGYEQPMTVFCTRDQYQEVTDGALSDRGFAMASVMDPEEIPVIDLEQEQSGGLQVIDTGVYTQRVEDLETQLDGMIARQQSVAISVNEVVKISKDVDYDLNLTTFTSLLNYLREQESDRKINVLTYSEYQQYEQLRQESYETALAEYAAFREEMLAALEELDMKEAAIARKLQETEKVDFLGREKQKGTDVSSESQEAAENESGQESRGQTEGISEAEDPAQSEPVSESDELTGSDSGIQTADEAELESIASESLS